MAFPAAAPHIAAMTQPTTLERAFTLARSGTCVSVDEIRQQLRRERYDHVDSHLAGHSISRQLRALCLEARRAAPPA